MVYILDHNLWEEDEHEMISTVESVHVHESYIPLTKENDISVLLRMQKNMTLLMFSKDQYNVLNVKNLNTYINT